jgi:hypothetical protein
MTCKQCGLEKRPSARELLPYLKNHFRNMEILLRKAKPNEISPRLKKKLMWELRHAAKEFR